MRTGSAGTNTHTQLHSSVHKTSTPDHLSGVVDNHQLASMRTDLGGCWTHLTFYITKCFLRGIHCILWLQLLGCLPQTPSRDSALCVHYCPLCPHWGPRPRPQTWEPSQTPWHPFLSVSGSVLTTDPHQGLCPCAPTGGPDPTPGQACRPPLAPFSACFWIRTEFLLI